MSVGEADLQSLQVLDAGVEAGELWAQQGVHGQQQAACFLQAHMVTPLHVNVQNLT